jgi:hypothetical protein
MNREEHDDDLVELGRATRQTRGGAIGFVDSERTLQPHLGLSAD